MSKSKTYYMPEVGSDEAPNRVTKEFLNNLKLSETFEDQVVKEVLADKPDVPEDKIREMVRHLA